MQNSALPTSSKQRRLTSKVWNDFKRVEVDGKHKAICNHCRNSFSGLGTSGTTHLRKHLSRCSAIQSGESSKRRRSASKVWNDFKRIEDDGKCWALCTHCHKRLTGSSKSGTTHLKNHLSRCSAIKNGESYKSMISSSEIGDLKNPTVINGNSVFDEERSGWDLVRMIIKSGYPLKNLQPMSKLHSQDTLKAGILRFYREEKEALCKYFDMLSCCFSLILNFWTCHGKRKKHCCFTLQFIEDGLKVKKILALKNVEYNYTGETLSEIVEGLLSEWNIKEKLCSITVKSSSANDQMVKIVESWLGHQGNNHPFRGKLFHIPCVAHIINLLVQDGLNEIDDILHKIKDGIKYISETTIGKQKFEDLVKKQNLEDEDITSEGVPIRWESAFLMLRSALEFRIAFSNQQSSDCDFPINLSMEEWDKATVMHKCLTVFYDSVCSFLGSESLSANVYLCKICDIHHNLLQWQESQHEFMSFIAKKMKETFDKYFDYCTHVSAIVAVFDPRTKMEFVRFSFKVVYGDNPKKCSLIDDALVHIFDGYAKDPSSQVLSSSFINNDNSSTSYGDNDFDILNLYKLEKGSRRAELYQYLQEPVFNSDGEFDILCWWQTNRTKFPTLWRMACDILAIPMSTSTSNSAFSIETTTVKTIFQGLDPVFIEALVCGKDWLDNPLRIAPNRNNKHFLELTHTSPLSAGTSLSLEAQEILGTGISPKILEVTVEHAQSCVLEKRMFLYSPPSSQQKTGVVFNVEGQVMGLLLECQYVPIDKLSETEKADAHNLVISAFEHWGEVISFDDEASIVGSSSHLNNVLYTSSSPRTESSNKMYKKHHPPSLHDEVWRLEKIGKDGAFHKCLSWESINTVKDFLILLFIDPMRLRNILGTGMSAKMWEVTVEHARTCVLEKRMFLYSPPSSQQKTGVVFNVVGQVMGLLLECQYVPIDKLSETEKADAHNLVISAFKHWGEVVSFDDEASIVGSSSHLTNILYTSSPPRTESSNGCKFLASHKIAGFDYSQQSASSPDIISSIYSVGGSSGLEDFALHGIDNMGLRYEQALSFPESMNHSFDDDHLNFFDTDLLTQSVNLESQSDLQNVVDNFISARAAIGKAQTRWTKLFSVLKWFSIRVAVRKRVWTIWGLRHEQALSFPESMNHSFDDDHLNFFDTDLLTQSVNLESQSDLQNVVDNFISARAAIGKAQTRWTKLFSVLKWFSIRVAVRKRVSEIPRYKSGLKKWFDNICKYSVSECCR